MGSCLMASAWESSWETNWLNAWGTLSAVIVAPSNERTAVVVAENRMLLI